jgi:hypothetical protein
MAETPPPDPDPDPDFAAYVAATAPLVGLTLDAAAQARIAAAMGLIRTIAAPALGHDLPPGTEPAPIFRP